MPHMEFPCVLHLVSAVHLPNYVDIRINVVNLQQRHNDVNDSSCTLVPPSIHGIET